MNDQDLCESKPSGKSRTASDRVVCWLLFEDMTLELRAREDRSLQDTGSLGQSRPGSAANAGSGDKNTSLDREVVSAAGAERTGECGLRWSWEDGQRPSHEGLAGRWKELGLIFCTKGRHWMGSSRGWRDRIYILKDNFMWMTSLTPHTLPLKVGSIVNISLKRRSIM